MKQKVKTILASGLAALLAVSLAACGGAPATSAPTNSTPAANAGDAPAPEASGEKSTLSVWHIWPDQTTGEGKTINGFLDVYKGTNPNVTVQQDASDTESYKSKLKIAFAGGDLPDVFFTYGAGFSRPFVDTGRMLALDEVVPAETLEKLMPGTDANFIYDGKLYALPLKMWAGIFFCNKELFDAAGLEIPKTMDDLNNAIAKFRADGIQPMTLGAKDGWHVAMYFDQIALREAGLEGVNAAMNGQKKFNDPEFLKAAEDLKALIDSNGFMDGFMGLGAQEAQAEFFMSKIPMYFNGSWLTGDIQNPDNQIQDKIVSVAFPSIPGGLGDGYYSGGAIDGWAVSAETPNIAQSVDFMASLCEYMSIQGYKAGDGIAVWKNDVPDSELNPVLLDINKNLETANGYCLAWDTQLAGADIDTYLQALQQLAGGGMTPQQFVDHLQANLSVAMK